MRATQIETVVAGRALLGEGPVWDAGTQTLVWVDILRCEVHRYDPATATDRSVRLPVVVGAARPCADGALVVAAGRGVARYDEADGSLDWLGRTAVGDRVNDATCDPAGRFWVGTLTVGGAGAALYRLDGRDVLTEVLGGVGLANGLAWSPDASVAYFADTVAEVVYAFDADVEAGALEGRRVFADLRDAQGRPDGMTVDAEGGVWVATARGGTVRRYRPDGGLDREIEFGMPGVTSMAFGGSTLQDLYVTTMCLGLGERDLMDHPRAGALLRVPDVGVTGLPATPFAGLAP